MTDLLVSIERGREQAKALSAEATSGKLTTGDSFIADALVKEFGWICVGKKANPTVYFLERR